MSVDFRQLEYFAAIVEQGSFTAAARKCRVAQPSLSAQIQKLEEELGEQLLLRKARGVVMTPGGQRVYEQATAMLAERDGLLTSFRERAEKEGGEVSLGIIPTVAPYLLGRLLGPFREEFPKIQVRVREAQTADLIRQLVDEELDFVVASNLTKTDRSRWSLHVRNLFVEDIHLAVPSQHPLASSRSGLIKLAEVPQAELLLLSEGHCLRDQTLELCRWGHEETGIQCEQLLTLQAMVAAGLGVAFVPRMLVEKQPVREVVYLRVREPIPQRTITVVKRRGKKLRPAAENLFRELLGRDYS